MGCLPFQIFLFHFQILFWPGPWIQSLWECSSNHCCQRRIYSPHLFSCQNFSHGGGVVGLTLLFLYLYLCKSLVHPAIPSCFLRLGSFYIIAVTLVSMTGTTIPRLYTYLQAWKLHWLSAYQWRNSSFLNSVHQTYLSPFY